MAVGGREGDRKRLLSAGRAGHGSHDRCARLRHGCSALTAVRRGPRGDTVGAVAEFRILGPFKVHGGGHVVALLDDGLDPVRAP
jgi:hypothetical protein